MQSFFLGLSYGYGSPAGCQRSFGVGGIGFSIKISAPHFDSLITGLLAISIL